MAALELRGTSYPVLLPKLRDPRLHLAATITALQVIGQVGFHFRVSIAQILLSLGTSALLEIAIAFRRQKVILWPASAMLTGNGVAFVLRVPGTQHGDWWSLRGWWIFVGAAAVSLLSKHVIRWRGEHIFNPSNIGLVICFLALGRGRADPLDFWWGPMSWWLVLALAVIVAGGLAILAQIALLRVAVSFWIAFALGIGGLALTGHAMTARWHLGPIQGFSFWWVLVTSPEVLVFLFFMITDPKTAPQGPRARVVYGVVLGVLASLLIAPTTTEFAAKVALLGALSIVCLAAAALRTFPLRIQRRQLVFAAAAGLAAYAAVAAFANNGSPSFAAAPLPPGKLPPISILPSPGVQTQLTEVTAEQIAHGLLSARPALSGQSLQVHLEQGNDQSPPTAVAQLGGTTYRLHVTPDGAWTLASGSVQPPAAPVPVSSALAAQHLTNVASAIGLEFQQGSFRFGPSNETKAMMGGGICWLDYNGDGWEDLFAVNSYASADESSWHAQGGLPRTALFENVHGRFRNVAQREHAALAVQGDGCAAGDLDGDGRSDLVLTTSSGVDVLWNDGRDGFRAEALPVHGWYTGTAIADVNGDGRPDIFVAGYADPNDPVANSIGGFPTNVAGVRDLLFLNEGHRKFREVGIQAGLEASGYRHGLGAVFTDVNGDGRPDLYVANDEDPNDLYVNVPWPGGAKADPAGLGFRFEERGSVTGVADPFAGMGIAAADGNLFVTNSRGEPSAAYRRAGSAFANARPAVDPALGTGFAGWGASWVDLANSGVPDLVLTAGAIPVTNLARDAESMRVLAPTSDGFGNASGVLDGVLKLNGRGLAAADADNDGRMEIAVNTIGGKLALLRPSGPAGHWLDVRLSRFVPGAVVTAVLPDGRTLSREVQAGSSYLSSEDPRVHLGLGAATRVATLSVRYPWGGETTLGRVAADRILQIDVPPERMIAAADPAGPVLATCTPSGAAGRSVARAWNDTAVAALRAGDASEPVQARDLYIVSAAVRDAFDRTRTAPARDEAISFAAYRVLLWQASHDANLARVFGLLTAQLRARCYSPDFAATSGDSPAAIGNRVAAAAIAAGRRDGSNESLRYADPSYTPQNQPLIVARSGSTVHDPLLWQPLALAQVSPKGSSPVPAEVQAFAGAEWGHVRTFALKPSPKGLPIDPGAPPLGADASSRAYRDAAIAVIRATAEAATGTTPDPSPAGWNALAGAIPAGGSPAARLRHDVELDLALNGALNDAAVAAWGAKRTYQSPRPISMIRYLAFNEQLPIVSGVTRKDGSSIEVRSRGRWVDGARWTPSTPTPASPGWVSSDAAFAYAADVVLTGLAGRSFTRQAARAASAGVDDGVELAIDVAAGRKIGSEAGKLALARIRRLGP